MMLAFTISKRRVENKLDSQGEIFLARQQGEQKYQSSEMEKSQL